MEVITFFKIFIFTLPFVAIIDFVWILFFAGSFYKVQLKDIARIERGSMKPNIVATLLVYLIMVAMYIIFVLPRIPVEANLLKAFYWGSLFGVSFSSVYNLTNYAIFKHYPLKVVFVDMSWALVFSGAISAVVFNISKII